MKTTPAIFFDHRHHLLRVRGCTAELDILGLTAEEALSTPFCYRLTFTCTDKALDPAAFLLQDGTLTLQAPVDRGFGVRVMQPVRVVQGVVTGFTKLATSKDEGQYELALQPRLALLSRSHQNAIYQDMSVPQIVEKILRERHDMRGQDFLFTLSREYPRREQVMQYGEDDLTFISRLLAEVGIWFRFTPNTRLSIDVVEFCDEPCHYQPGVTLPAVPPSGMHDVGVESVWDLVSAHRVVEKSVSTRDYNYRCAADDLSAQAEVTHGEATTYGEAYHYADNYLTAGAAGHNPAPESGAFYARIHHERYLNAQTQLTAVTSCAGIAPGQRLTVTGGLGVPDAFRRGVVITALTATARRDKSFEVTITAIPCAEAYGFRPPLIARPKMAGTLPARVTSTKTNDLYGHIDKHGRYKVTLLFDRAAWPAGEESLWVRQSRPYAGDTYGLHLPLLAGTEVAIGFEDGNPDRPYLAGVLHDSSHPDHVTIRNYKRNVLRTPANNKLRLDDTRGQEHIKLATEYGGKSQLNLGYLVDSERQPRGEGFELRTDSYGTIRAGKGLFISADAQPMAQGKVLEMEAALTELEAARQVTAGLRHAAEAAEAELADLTKQTELMNTTLANLKQQALLMSAPAGIAMVTPASVQLSAKENLIATAGSDADFSIVKKFRIAVGEALSLFAHRMGIKMFATAGKIEIQAQSDALDLLAEKQLTIASQKNRVLVTAQTELLLNCGGSYIRLSEGGIELGTAKNVTMKCIVIQRMGADTLENAVKLPTGCKPGIIKAAQAQDPSVTLSS
ncbi:type VI secretion system tip protein VgrG [Chimaeribacter californicus]|uniref:Type VI secretion system tip protein VgrG n=1 Tax=Chimaeribacter californicus TaxID=2060067 RepID=A0A2N5EE59_9GAMM|nr:type VI secretion system Vgr family protein [Chimaeribacter californicus]PLR40819.1 type VI secretion system tip protein VgrG [Chimaeribacter californicus]